MKRLIMMSVAAASIMAANAADVTVYNNGTLAAGLQVYDWWASVNNFTAADPTGGDTKVFKFNVNNGAAAGSMGIMDYAGQPIELGKLHSSTLNFRWYAEGTGTYTVRLTGGVDENYTWTVTADNAGSWQTATLPLAEYYPKVAEAWENYASKGDGYIFSVVVENASADAAIYFDNIYYSNIDEAWEAPEQTEIVPPTTVPDIKQASDDVLSVFSADGKMAFNIGGWGQSTTASEVSIDGKDVYKLTNYNYLGWEFPDHFSIEGYDYMHVDFYPCEQTAFGFTPISPGQEKGWVAPEVKVNEWNSYDAPISYFSNVVLDDIFQIKFDQGEKVEAYLANVYFWKDNGETPEDPEQPAQPATGTTYKGSVDGTYEQTMAEETKEYPYTLNYSVSYNEDKTLSIEARFVWAEGEPVGTVAGSVFVNNVLNDFTLTDGVRTATTTDTFESGAEVPLNFYIPVANGVVQVPVTYTVGSTNTNTGVADINLDANAPVEYYNLQGVRVANPERGLYIRVQNGRATKVIL